MTNDRLRELALIRQANLIQRMRLSHARAELDGRTDDAELLGELISKQEIARAMIQAEAAEEKP